MKISRRPSDFDGRMAKSLSKARKSGLASSRSVAGMAAFRKANLLDDEGSVIHQNVSVQTMFRVKVLLLFICQLSLMLGVMILPQRKKYRTTHNHIKDALQSHLLYLPHGQAHALLTMTSQLGRRGLPLRQQQTSSPTRSAGQPCALIPTAFPRGQPYLPHGQAPPLVTMTSQLRRRLLPPSPQNAPSPTRSACKTSTLESTAPTTCG